MAATNETSFPDRNRGWFQDQLVDVNEPMRKLLEGYSGVPSSDVVPHINKIRERGFAANPYPCIGLYRFTNLTLLTHPLYQDLIKTLKRPNTTYLDIGCCFGQDLRRLVFDGVASEKLTGLDVEKPLMELGYDLFMDRQSLKSRFVVADVFQGSAQEAWTNLQEQGFDVLHCSAFFHLFPLEQQFAAAKEITKLVKIGGILVGRQMGSIKPGNVAAIRDNSYSYRHDVATLNEMWNRVGEDTQTRWRVEGSLDMVGINPASPVENEHSRRLLFTVTRIA